MSTPPDENCLQRGEVVSSPMVRNSVDQGHSTASQGAVTEWVWLRSDSAYTCPPSPILPLLLTQNLSSKQIALNNNVAKVR